MSEGVHIVCPHCDAVNRTPQEKNAAVATCGRCGHKLFDGHPANVGDSGLMKQIERSDIPVVVDFWAEWCGPCRTMAPGYAMAATELEPRIRFLKVDVDQHKQAAAKYGVLAAEFVVGKWAAITSAIGAARTAFIAFDVAAMMNPFGWVIGAIAAVTALGLALWHYRKPIYEWFHQPGPARNGGSLNGAPAVGAHGVRIGKVEVHVHQRPGEDAHALAHRVAKIVTDGRRHARLASYQDDF